MQCKYSAASEFGKAKQITQNLKNKSKDKFWKRINQNEIIIIKKILLEIAAKLDSWT